MCIRDRFTTTNTSARAQYNLGSLTTGNTYTQSYYIKSLGADITLRIGTSGGAVGEFTDIIATSEWQRFEFSGIASGTTEFPRVQNITGTSGAEILVWGAQFEQQSYATSYIPTQGATSTRLRDLATDSGNATLINSSEGVLYAEISSIADSIGDSAVSLNNSTSSNRVWLGYSTAANKIWSLGYSSGALQFVLSHNLTTDTEMIKTAVKYKDNDFALWLNGTEVATDNSGVSPQTLNNLSFDMNGNGGGKFFGKAKALAVYKEALTDAELQSLTTI